LQYQPIGITIGLALHLNLSNLIRDKASCVDAY
jgi:hypothetical protein